MSVPKIFQHRAANLGGLAGFRARGGGLGGIAGARMKSRTGQIAEAVCKRCEGSGVVSSGTADLTEYRQCPCMALGPSLG